MFDISPNHLKSVSETILSWIFTASRVTSHLVLHCYHLVLNNFPSCPGRKLACCKHNQPDLYISHEVSQSSTVGSVTSQHDKLGTETDKPKTETLKEVT